MCERIVARDYEFIGFGAIDVIKSCKFIWFGDIRGLKPYAFMRSRATIISHTPVSFVSIRCYGLRAGRLGVFSYFYWSFFDFVSIRELFGMAGRPRSRPLGVDSGPGEGGLEGVRGANSGGQTGANSGGQAGANSGGQAGANSGGHVFGCLQSPKGRPDLEQKGSMALSSGAESTVGRGAALPQIASGPGKLWQGPGEARLANVGLLGYKLAG